MVNVVMVLLSLVLPLVHLPITKGPWTRRNVLRVFLLYAFVLLCLKIFSICANHAAKAVSFSVLALRAANNAVMTFRPFSVTTVTVRFGHFYDQAMRPQQSQATSDGRHLFVLLLFVLGRRVEMGTQITITKSVERTLPTVDDGEKLSVALSQWIKRSVTVSVPPYGTTDLRGLLGQRGLHMDCSQSGQVSLGGFPTHFRAPVKVRYAAAQFAPALRAARTFLGRAKAAKISRFIDRCLNAQDAALVIAFKRVLIDPVLDPYAVRPATSIALHLLKTHPVPSGA